MKYKLFLIRNSGIKKALSVAAKKLLLIAFLRQKAGNIAVICPNQGGDSRKPNTKEIYITGFLSLKGIK